MEERQKKTYSSVEPGVIVDVNDTVSASGQATLMAAEKTFSGNDL